MTEELKLDELDRRILALLSRNSRLSYREIAKQIGVSHANVSGRIRRLEEEGVIKGYTVILDPDAMNLYPLCLRISAGPQADLSEIGSEIAKLDKVHVVLRVSGDCELLALTMCEDRHEALRLLSEISSISGVEKAESHVVLESIKLSGKNLR
jgi:Lrp/AsnC family transcriptional regulator for asnA, asnC and gidA